MNESKPTWCSRHLPISIGIAQTAMIALALLALLGHPKPGNAQSRESPSAVAPDASAASASPSTSSESLEKSARFRELASELRCLVCQNQTLADSNAPLALDLRNEVIRLMREGRDDAQIKTYLVDRYGEFVLYRPSLTTRNALLWFGPFALLAVGGLVWWRIGRRKPGASGSADDALRRVDELLGR